MNHLLSKKQLNNQKNKQIKGKITKSSTTFSENKPNFKNIKIGISSFETSKYEISPACRGENQTQFKADSNPIAKRPKMNLNIYYTKEYNNETAFSRKKTKPIQTQFQRQKVLQSFSSAVIVKSEFIRYQHKVFYNVMFKIKGAVK